MVQLNDANFQSLMTALSVIVTTFIGAVVTIYLASINRKADETKVAAKITAEKVEDVKTALIDSDSKTDHKLNEIHSLVNSKFTTLLKTNAIALRRVANVSRDKEDEAAAVYAETALESHEKDLQGEVDHLKVEIVKIPDSN